MASQSRDWAQIDNFEEIKDRITVVDNQYVLNLSRKNNLLTEDQVEALHNYLEAVNTMIREYNITDVSVENGFSVEISDAEIIAKTRKLLDLGYDDQLYDFVSSEEWMRSSSFEGSWGLNVYWWGVEVWLPRWFVQLCVTCAATAGVVLAGTLPPIGKLAVSVAIAAAGFTGTHFAQPLIIGMFWNGYAAYIVPQTPAHTPPPPGGGTPPILVP